MDDIKRLVIVGLGGVGGWLAEPVARWVWASGITSRRLGEDRPLNDIVLVDDDKFDAGNAMRQRMDPSEIGVGKAAAWARRLRGMFPELGIAVVDERLDRSNAARIIKEGDCVFMCVDNHYARRAAQERVSKLKNGVLISGGNEYTDGSVQVNVRRDGIDLSPSIFVGHEEIEFAEPAAAVSCAVRVSSAPQLVWANLTVAALMGNALYGVMSESQLPYREVQFDCVSNRANSFK